MDKLKICDGGIYDDGNDFYECHSSAKQWFIYPSGKPFGWCGGPGCPHPWSDAKEVTYEEAMIAYIMTS